MNNSSTILSGSSFPTASANASASCRSSYNNCQRLCYPVCFAISIHTEILLIGDLFALCDSILMISGLHFSSESPNTACSFIYVEKFSHFLNTRMSFIPIPLGIGRKINNCLSASFDNIAPAPNSLLIVEG